MLLFTCYFEHERIVVISILSWPHYFNNSGGIGPWWINVRENRRRKIKMDNSETRATLATRHSTQKNKKQKEQEPQRRKLRKRATRTPSNTSIYNPADLYLSVCTRRGQWVALYICARGMFLCSFDCILELFLYCGILCVFHFTTSS